MTCISRRSLLIGAGSGVVFSLAGVPADASRNKFFSPARPLGLQLFAVLDELNNDLAATLERIAAIGYRRVEMISTLPYTAYEMRSALKGAGLTCRSGIYLPHFVPGIGGINLTDDFDRIVEDAHTLDLEYVVMAFTPAPARLREPQPGEGMGGYFARVFSQINQDDWRLTADALNEASIRLASAGLRIGYHNHDHELRPLAGTTALEILLTNTAPEVTFELDAGWVNVAGQDAAALLRRHPGRFRLMHIKDFRPAGEVGAGGAPGSVEVGSVDTNWQSILRAAEEAGVEEFFVEQEPPFLRPALYSAKDSFDYLAKLGA